MVTLLLFQWRKVRDDTRKALKWPFFRLILLEEVTLWLFCLFEAKIVVHLWMIMIYEQPEELPFPSKIGDSDRFRGKRSNFSGCQYKD